MEYKLSAELLLLLLSISTICSAQSIYYVKPSRDTPCPVAGEPCHTLSEYVADQYFENLTMNTTMEFLPGNHTLEQIVSVINLMWFALHGNSSSLPKVTSTIVCTRPAGFVFTDITELYISALAFIACGNSAAVSVTSVQHSHISNSSFQNNIGRALVVKGSTLNLTGNTFQNNSAADDGGALSVYKSTLNLTGNTFHNNSAGYGGALAVDRYPGSDSTLNLTWRNFSGGALSVRFSTFSLTGNTFHKNFASHAGGALSALFSTFSLTGNTFHNNFADNMGGALVVQASTVILTGNTFQNNSAGVQGGGALRVYKSTLKLTRNTFHNNSASHGGALHSSWTCKLYLMGNIFQTNSAMLGGALCTDETFINFTDDYFTDSYAQMGGAIFVTHSNLIMYKNIKIGNSRAEYGGGIAAFDSLLRLVENTIFMNNRAIYGGGLYTHNTEVHFNGNATFIKNSVVEGGGGVYAYNSSFQLKTTTTIISNSARDGGGLLLSGDSKLNLRSGTALHLINNSAKTGGAIKVEESNRLTYCIPSQIGDYVVKGSDCFFQIQARIKPLPHFASWNQVKQFIKRLNVYHTISFYNNSAVEAGTDLYGGSIDICALNIILIESWYLGPEPSGYVFDVITRGKNTPDISSYPLDICACNCDNQDLQNIDCTGSYHPGRVYPGGILDSSHCTWAEERENCSYNTTYQHI